MADPTRTPGILAVDIGGSGIKASVIDHAGRLLAERVRVKTPVGKHPDAAVRAIQRLSAELPPFDRIAVGFPGVVRDGRVKTAATLHHDAWRDYPLADSLARALDRPCRLGNDADVQGFAVIRGQGLEMVVTLGTGFGSSTYRDGRIALHLELAHHRFRNGQTYNEQLGDAARRRIGARKWQARVRKMIDNLRVLVCFDRLYIGGGNAKRIEGELPADVTIVDNDAGISGGAWLWRD
jgi:polyphosphate glucokinase